MTVIAKSTVNAFLGVVALLTSILFWKTPSVAVVFLGLVSLAIYKINPSKAAVVVYFAAFIAGPISEIIAIHNRVWQYATPQFFGVPIWLPFVWGAAGLFLHNTSILARELFPNK